MLSSGELDSALNVINWFESVLCVDLFVDLQVVVCNFNDANLLHGLESGEVEFKMASGKSLFAQGPDNEI